MKVYIYPTYTPSRDKSGNLYIKYFHDAFKNNDNWKVVNRCWKIGIASLLFNLDADVIIIQWVDLIPYKRLGKIQFIFFLILTKIARLAGKKIIWVLHNKHSHNGNSKLVDYGMMFLATNSTSVMTHSKEGVSFFDKMYPKYKGKCHYIPHPVYTEKLFPPKTLKWDYIIWGSINRRKRVYEFLKFAMENSFTKDKRILVCGRCKDEQYDQMIRSVINNNVTYINKFLSDDEIENYISQSCFILFTYNPDSVLSSGALIYSLNFCKPIIGPNVGSFADLKGIVSTYNKFQDIPLIDAFGNFDKNLCIRYIKENSWQNLPLKVKFIL